MIRTELERRKRFRWQINLNMMKSIYISVACHGRQNSEIGWRIDVESWYHEQSSFETVEIFGKVGFCGLPCRLVRAEGEGELMTFEKKLQGWFMSIAFRFTVSIRCDWVMSTSSWWFWFLWNSRLASVIWLLGSLPPVYDMVRMRYWSGLNGRNSTFKCKHWLLRVMWLHCGMWR